MSGPTDQLRLGLGKLRRDSSRNWPTCSSLVGGGRPGGGDVEAIRRAGGLLWLRWADDGASMLVEATCYAIDKLLT
jgi:hypothetical protein